MRLGTNKPVLIVFTGLLSRDLVPDTQGQWGSETSSSTGPLTTTGLLRPVTDPSMESYGHVWTVQLEKLVCQEPAPPGPTLPKLFMPHRLHFSEEYLTKYVNSDLTDDTSRCREKQLVLKVFALSYLHTFIESIYPLL